MDSDVFSRIRDFFDSVSGVNIPKGRLAWYERSRKFLMWSSPILSSTYSVFDRWERACFCQYYPRHYGAYGVGILFDVAILGKHP